MVLAALLTTFAGSLFQVLSVTVSAQTSLHAAGSFGFAENQSWAYNESVPSNGGIGVVKEDALRYTPLILQSNVSYPPFTFEDLAFPEFSLAGIDVDAKNIICGPTRRPWLSTLLCQQYAPASPAVSTMQPRSVSRAGRPIKARR